MDASSSRTVPAEGRRLLVVVGQSGVGKDAVLNEWVRSSRSELRPCIAQRVITRAAHAQTEAHEPVDEPTFRRLAAEGLLAFHWRAHGLCYGVRWTELELLKHGRCVVVNSSRAYLPELRRRAPSAVVVEITAPEAVRRQRLAARGREGTQGVEQRLARQAPQAAADLVLVNAGHLEDAVHELDDWWARHCLAMRA
jgi:ribose 1,5-bisphosphokinase